MRVLSLFDGISCGRIALERVGIEVERYVAYEIDEPAIIVSNWNYPTIEHKGSVEGADFTQYEGFDLVIGGFPCTDLSISKMGREGLAGKSSRLFWEQVRAIKEINPRYFLVENNYGMPKKDEAIITETLGVQPIFINSALVSAQNRKRLYWTNIPGVVIPEDAGVLLKDIIKNVVPLKYFHSEAGARYLFQDIGEPTRRINKIQNTAAEKSNTLTASFSKGLPNNCLAVPARVGDLGKGSQAARISSTEGKSVCLTSGGGGMGAKTGLYAVPYGAALRSWPRNTSVGRYKKPEFRLDGKANALTTVTTDSMVVTHPYEGIPFYEVLGGKLLYKGREIPVKLLDGFYSIRRLTPEECEHLQTVPEGYTEMVSDTQRYRQLGNGWTL